MPALFTAQGGRGGGGGGSYRGATRLRLVSISLGLTANRTPRQDRLLWRESFISAPPAVQLRAGRRQTHKAYKASHVLFFERVGIPQSRRRDNNLIQQITSACALLC